MGTVYRFTLSGQWEFPGKDIPSMWLLAADLFPTFRAIVIELIRRQLETGKENEIRFPLVGSDWRFDHYPVIANFQALSVRGKVGDDVELGFRQDLTILICDRDEIGQDDLFIAQPGSTEGIRHGVKGHDKRSGAGFGVQVPFASIFFDFEAGPKFDVQQILGRSFPKHGDGGRISQDQRLGAGIR